MAASVAYSAEEVERVILALYSGQNVAEADRWLTLFVASPAAWEISLGMISRLPTTTLPPPLRLPGWRSARPPHCLRLSLSACL